jgi:hypothetical protein
MVDPCTDSLRNALLVFLEANPEACDALEGIATFWVPGANQHILEAVLGQLVQEGVLSRIHVGQRSHYCLALRPELNEPGGTAS